ncbi:hypothetical protein [Polynucleobacter rarus]|uniref:hypothetical protein n=1 Tax=Polynucleobacter rarus TaxID=556055 RepID=UPI000D3E286D|nr:hypothetical protein [Polynucleobacter rarus]
MNTPQLMWVDVITAVLAQPTFDVKIGNMGYVFKNMIAKYVSSADYYRVSYGAFNEIIKPNLELLRLIEADEPLDMKKYFYGKDKPSLLEHMIPTSVTAKALLDLGKNPSKDDVSYILRNSGEVAIVLREEDKLLSKSKMPKNWTFSDSYYARYREAGIELVDNICVRRNGTIYR